jgi:hypothetical protein
MPAFPPAFYLLRFYRFLFIFILWNCSVVVIFGLKHCAFWGLHQAGGLNALTREGP